MAYRRGEAGKKAVPASIMSARGEVPKPRVCKKFPVGLSFLTLSAHYPTKQFAKVPFPPADVRFLGG